MTRTAWPATSAKVAFTPGVFTETTLGVTAPGAAEAFDFERGREYELGRTQSGTGKVVWDNRDGRYVPTNASSPYAGLLQVYRELKIEATWNGTLYGVVRGYIERWPTSYSANGNYSETTTPIVDALTLLAGQDMRSVADHEVLADGPTALYKLNEPSTSTSAGDSINPGVNPSAVRRDSKYGAGTVTFGANAGLADGATGVAFTSSDLTGNPYAAASGLSLAYNTRQGAFVPTAGPWSVELWIVTPTFKPTSLEWTLALQSSEQGQDLELAIFSSGGVNFDVENPSGLINHNSVSGNVCDGRLHHIVGTLGVDGKTTNLYVDGQLVSTYTAASAYTFDSLRYHCLGARVTSASVQGYQFPGTISRYAVYPTALSAARILSHYQSGSTAFSGEDSGARIARFLTYFGWPAALTDVGAGTSVMGPALVEGKSFAEGIQNAADDELGNLWISGAGKVTFRGRQVRQTTLTSALTFGERESAGELPYDGTVQFDFDPDYVIDEQQVSRTGGATFTSRATTSVLPFHKSGNPRTIEVLNDYEAADQANWLITQYGIPKMRVASLTIIPSANPALWPAALGTDINTRITVKRRALNQPTISIDCWVEAVQHRVTAYQWLTTFLLSPVDTPRALLWDTDVWDDPAAVWSF